MRKLGLLAVLLAFGCGGSSEDGNGGGGTGGGTGGTGGGGTGGGGTGGVTGGTGGGGTGGIAGGGTGGGGTGGIAGGGGTGGGGTGGTGGLAGGGGTAGAGGCGWCDFVCCNGQCTNTGNDIKNCGGCGMVCPGNTPFCENGTCKTQPPCSSSGGCPSGEVCCGTTCCTAGQLCCDVPGPVGNMLGCQAPNQNGTCNPGCTSCVCNSPETPIATPTGNRRISELAVGDLVYSVHQGAVRAVPIREVHRVPAPNHRVVEVALASGVTLQISPRHPTADGRTFGELGSGDRLDGVAITAVSLVPYQHSHTFDILPDSDSGTYFAGGVLIASTLGGDPSVGQLCETSAPSSR